MKHYRNFIVLALIFIAVSAFLYFLHYLLFRDAHHIFLYLVGDLAFLPLEVFLVVIVIERILNEREKQAMLQKLNMVVGAFFSEVGTDLLSKLLGSFDNRDEISRRLHLNPDWKHDEFKKAASFAEAIVCQVNYEKLDLAYLRAFLVSKRPFLLALLENPNLLEHESFTDLLWATFHLAEELESRPSFTNLPGSDLGHLAGDMQRVFGRLCEEWIHYAEHLKSKYPYLFSLFLRLQPFQDKPLAVVT